MPRRKVRMGSQYGLRGIARDIEHGLDELLRIAAKFGQAHVVVAFHPDALRKLGKNESANAFTYLVDVHRHLVRGAMRSEKSVHESLQPVGLLDDHPRVFAQARPVELTLEELSRTAQPPQGMLDFMGQVADRLPVGPVLGHALLFSFDAKPPVDRPKLKEQSGRRQLDWRNDAVDVQGLLTRRHEDQVLISETALLANGLMQQACQGARVREKSRKGLVEDALAAGRH